MSTLETMPVATTPAPATSGTGVSAAAVRAVFYAAFKHSRLVVGTFLLIFMIAAVIGVIRPATWMASTTVLVKIGDIAQEAPSQAPSKSYYLPMTPDVVKTEADIVKSDAVIRQAAQRVGIEPEPGTSVDEMVAKMQLALTVTPSPGANTLQISYIGRDPGRVARMANAITDVYLDHHNRVYRTHGLRGVYSEQVRILQGEMKTAQRRYRDYMKREHVVDVEQEIPLLTKELILQDRELQEHRLKTRGVEKKQKEVQKQVAESPVQIPYSQDFHANPTRQIFENNLATLEVAKYKALEEYLPTDRHVRELEEQIADVKARIADEKERLLMDEELRYSDLHEVLMRNAATLEVLLADLHTREPGLRQRVAATRKRLASLRDKRSTLANLKEDADEKAYAYDLYRKRNDQARIQDAMTDQSMVNLAVVQRAMPPLEPQNGLLLPLLLGLVGGLALATGLAVAIEYANRTLRFPEEVEHYLELPVLAVIPELETTMAIARIQA